MGTVEKLRGISFLLRPMEILAGNVTKTQATRNPIMKRIALKEISILMIKGCEMKRRIEAEIQIVGIPQQKDRYSTSNAYITHINYSDQFSASSHSELAPLTSPAFRSERET